MIMMIKVKLHDGLTLSQKVPTIVDPGVDSTRYPLSDLLKTQNFNQFYFHYFSCLVFTSVLLQDEKEKKKTKTKTLNN